MRFHRITCSILAVTLLVPLAAAPSDAALLDRLGPKLVPSTGALLGIYAKERQGRSHNEEIRHVEKQVGRRFAIDHFYFHFDDSLADRHVRATITQGRIPLINWKPEARRAIRWSTIATGGVDRTIDRAAAELRRLKTPVMLAFHHEPENDAGKYGTARQFRFAFRHIVKRFKARRATNVVFVCILEGFTYDGGHGGAKAWFPERYADWAGADAYNWAPGRRGFSWRSFEEAFSGFYAWGSKRRVPLMAAEFGTQERPGDPNAKAAWLNAARATIRSWPRLKAVVYFNSDKKYRWWIDTSKRSLAAFRALAQDTHFRP
ncbi:MAG: hypothetical protein QOF68_1254 [Gaiellales bacterium]|nr:hypothetical protein [Gaiellales bacterium]